MTDTKKRIRSELRAALYLYNDETFIVCSIAGIAEYGEPIVLDADSSDEQLGLALCDKLLAYKPGDNRDRLQFKLDDWAAFKASGATSGKAFEARSTYAYQYSDHH